MPRLEPKIIQKELEQGWLWPVYWLYGLEKMKSRELLKRIRAAVLGDSTSSLRGLSETVLDGGEVDAGDVLEVALSQSLGQWMPNEQGTSPSLVVVREAHALKNMDLLAELLRPKGKRADVGSVCVFLSKDLDGRKKFSKALLEKAAVVSCEEVPEADRDAWIQYLMKRRGMALPEGVVAQLATLDPWTLDIIDQELEKHSLLGAAEEGPDSRAGFQRGLAGGKVRSDDFIGAFFSRDLKSALSFVENFADQADESLPLLGLLAWNTRYLALALTDPAGLRSQKMSPYLAERLQRWTHQWKVPEVLELQAELAAMDLSLKQTPLLPLGVWCGLVTRFCENAP